MKKITTPKEAATKANDNSISGRSTLKGKDARASQVRKEDYLWFKKHPTRTYRIRPTTKEEAPKGGNWATIIQKLQKDYRAKYIMPTNTEIFGTGWPILYEGRDDKKNELVDLVLSLLVQRVREKQCGLFLFHEVFDQAYDLLQQRGRVQ